MYQVGDEVRDNSAPNLSQLGRIVSIRSKWKNNKMRQFLIGVKYPALDVTVYYKDYQGLVVVREAITANGSNWDVE